MPLEVASTCTQRMCAGSSSTSGCGSAKTEDHATVTEAFCGRVCKDTQNLIIARFKETGDVQAWQGHRQTPPANKVGTAEDDLWLLGNVLDDPAATLEARAAEFALATGKKVHVSTICRALHRLDCAYMKACTIRSAFMSWHGRNVVTGLHACACLLIRTMTVPSGQTHRPEAARAVEHRPLAAKRRAVRSSQMQHWAVQRDEDKALAFWCELMTFHSLELIPRMSI